MAGAPYEFKIEVDGPTLERFLLDDGELVCIQGPYGSGKTRAAIQKLMLNAARQPISPRTGKRHCSTLVVREAYWMLEKNVLKPWREVFPPEVFGTPSGKGPITHEIRIGDLEWDVTFLALDGTDDKARVEGMEPTNGWINEGRHLPWATIKLVLDRLGRYPSPEDGGVFVKQLIVDTNAPPEDHPITVLSGQAPIPANITEDERGRYIKPDNWSFYVQPPAAIEKVDATGSVTGYDLNPARENQRYLPEDYYPGLLRGATRAEIRERVLNRPGSYMDAKAVWPSYREETHVPQGELQAAPGIPLIVGIDFGRTPSAIFTQQVFGQWRALHEFLAENMGARQFARLLRNELAQQFPGMQYALFGDPAGEHLAEADDISPMIMFRAEGLKILPAPTNDFIIRRDAVAEALNQLVDGKPRLIVSKKCTVLRAAMAGGYQYRRLMVSGLARYSDRPDKNRYSHPADALQYALIGGGEGRALLSSTGAGTGGGRVVVARRPSGWGFLRGR